MNIVTLIHYAEYYCFVGMSVLCFCKVQYVEHTLFTPHAATDLIANHYAYKNIIIALSRFPCKHFCGIYSNIKDRRKTYVHIRMQALQNFLLPKLDRFEMWVLLSSYKPHVLKNEKCELGVELTKRHISFEMFIVYLLVEKRRPSS